jgi:parvulin-like peptidyl-prolyl isomerase
MVLVAACGDEAKDAPPPPPPGMAGAGAPVPGATNNPGDVVAEVGPTKMTRLELDRAIFRDAVMSGLPPPSKEPRVKELLEAPSYDKMIDRELLRQEAARRGLTPKPEEVDAQKKQMAASLPPGKTFESILGEMGVDEATFLRDLATDMSIEKLLGQVAAETPPPDDAALRKVFDADAERYSQRQTASASHILVKVAPNAAPDVVTAAEKKAKALRDEVVGKDKATFQRVATEKSEDASAKINHGDLGSFEAKQMLPELADAAFKLKEGEVSPVVRSDKGFHILFGQGVVQGKKRTFEEVKPELLQREVERANIGSIDVLIAKLKTTVPVVRHLVPKASPLGGPQQPGPPPSAPGPSSQPAGGGIALPPPGGAPKAAAGPGQHPGMPLPTKDNVLPGAPNPHAATAPGSAPGELKVKVDGK